MTQTVLPLSFVQPEGIPFEIFMFLGKLHVTVNDIYVIFPNDNINSSFREGNVNGLYGGKDKEFVLFGNNVQDRNDILYDITGPTFPSKILELVCVRWAIEFSSTEIKEGIHFKQ